MSRRSGTLVWVVIIVTIPALYLAWQYIDYRAATRLLPPGMTMAGMPVEGLAPEAALVELESAFNMSLEVIYRDEREVLTPDTVELRYDIEQTEASLDQALSEQGGLDGFVTHVLRRPAEPVAVPVAVSFSEERLDGFLTRVATQHDHPPQDPVPLPDSLTFRAGQPGYEMDWEPSRARLAAALLSASDSRVELVVDVGEAPELEIGMLEQLLETRLDDHPGLIPGIFVKDLQTGDELAINGEVAYAGLSVLKIAILEETYRVLDRPLQPEVSDWLSNTLGVVSSNFQANLLLRDVIGGGDGFQGAENLTRSMNHLGLNNTFMVAPYDEVGSVNIVTPANSRTDVTTYPDPYMQTTPVDMGLLLEMIYQCSQGGGGLMVAYPGSFTAEECREMITHMGRNQFDSLVEIGVPPGTEVVHKHGFTADTHADASIVFSPGGDFVLVVFLYRPTYLEWEESNPLVADIATATYNYFNPAN